MRGVVIAFGACAALTVSFAAPPAMAEEPPSAARLKAAADEYDLGRRAFLAEDFEGAAVHFENAFRDAPRAETVRLAIRARRKAKQPARAATLAAVAQQRYASDTATAQLAKETLDEAGPSLQEYLVECSAECSIAADGRVVSQSDATKHRIYLDPGSHDVGVSFKQGGSVARRVEARRGGKDDLGFFDVPPAPKVPVPVVEKPKPPSAVPPESTKPLSPVVFFVGAGLTAVVGAATVVSGIDAQNNPGVDAVRRACAGKDESCPQYQDGKSAETRTNVLLGVTIGAAVITGVIGVFFTQWSSSRASTGAGTGTGLKLGAGPMQGGAALGAVGSF